MKYYNLKSERETEGEREVNKISGNVMSQGLPTSSVKSMINFVSHDDSDDTKINSTMMNNSQKVRKFD